MKKGILFGALGIMLIQVFFWIFANYQALVMAVQYPEVVKSLKVQKNFEVKK